MKNPQPLFSVIVTSFNRKLKLQRAVETILSQTFLDYEVVIVDDASTDGSQSYLRSLNFNNVKVFLLEDNLKQARATNFAVSQAKGKYLAFLDADDYWSPVFLNSIVSLGLNNSEYNSISGYFCASNIVNEAGAIIRVNKVRSEVVSASDIKTKNLIGAQSRVVVKKAVYDAVGGLDIDLPSCKDWDLWIRISNLGYKFAGLDTAQVFYEENVQSISSNLNVTIAGRHMLWSKHFDFSDDQKLLNQQYCLFAKFLFNRGHTPDARAILVKSIKNRSSNLKTFIYFLVTFIPAPLVRAIYRFLR